MSLKQETKLVQAHIQEVQSGKSSAFEQLYRTHVSRIYSFGLKVYNLNKQASEELARRVFINAFKQILEYPENVTFILWLRALAVIEVKKNDMTATIDDSESGIVDKAIFSLPLLERIIFILHDVDKLPAEEVGEITKKTTVEINFKLDFARKFLIGKLELKNTDELERKLAFLPQKVEPKEDLWINVYSEVHKIATRDHIDDKNEDKVLSIGDAKETLSEKYKKRKERKKNEAFIRNPLKFTVTRRTIYTFVSVIIIVAALALVIFIKSPQWEVINLSGDPAIKGNRKNIVIKNNSAMEKDDMLFTNNVSKALIKVPGIAEIYLEPGTSVIRTGGKGELSISKGGIDIVKITGSKPFPVQVFSAIVKDYRGNAYSIVKENSEARVYSTEAYLIISTEEKEVYLLPQYMCQIRPNSGLGIPYSLSANEEYISAINDFSLEANNERLNIILLLSEKKDALTLFNILRRVNADSREVVIKKLNSIVGIPKDVKFYDVANLNEDALQKWLKAIEELN